MARRGWYPPGPGQPNEKVDGHDYSAPSAPIHRGSRRDTVEAHYAGLERPHACNNGWVTLSQIALDPETGEEVEEHALYLCRRCACSKAGR